MGRGRYIGLATGLPTNFLTSYDYLYGEIIPSYGALGKVFTS